MAREGAPCAAAVGLPADGFRDAAVEALDETVCLRPIGSGQAVIDHLFSADKIERVTAGRPALRLVLHVDGKAVGELGAVIGQDGVNAIGELGQEAPEKARRSLSIAPSMDFDIDVAGGTVDCDEDIAFAPLQGSQMLQIDMNEADRRLFKDADTGLGRLVALANGMALEATMDGAA